MSDQEILDLVKRWQENRDEDAISQLYSHYRNFVFWLSKQKYARDLDAESIAYDAFNQAITYFDGRVKFHSYWSHIFFKRCSQLKRKKRIKLESFNQDALQNRSTAKKRLKSMLNLTNLELNELISLLPDREASVLKLFIEGNNFADIGKIYGIHRNSVGICFRNAVLSLKQKMGEISSV